MTNDQVSVRYSASRDRESMTTRFTKHPQDNTEIFDHDIHDLNIKECDNNRLAHFIPACPHDPFNCDKTKQWLWYRLYNKEWKMLLLHTTAKPLSALYEAYYACLH